MADKYIIEKHEKDSIWRMYADAYGDVTVEGVDLTPYTEPDTEKVRKEAYEQGLSHAWEAARKIANMPYGEEEKVFGSGGWKFIINHTASEAIEKIRQYEQEKKEIQVGDEVYVEKLQGKAVVMQTGKIMCCTFQNGDTFTPHMKDCKKTGRHFPEIAEVLQKMKEES